MVFMYTLLIGEFFTLVFVFFFFFKQKTAYEMRISDWSSDVCSSDLDASKGDERLPVAITTRYLADGALQSDVALYDLGYVLEGQIGRASCRERVCQYV